MNSTIYILSAEMRVATVLSGDAASLTLNLPEGMSFTFIEPEDYFRQVFDIATQQWIYPEEAAPDDEEPGSDAEPPTEN